MSRYEPQNVHNQCPSASLYLVVCRIHFQIIQLVSGKKTFYTSYTQQNRLDRLYCSLYKAVKVNKVLKQDSLQAWGCMLGFTKQHGTVVTGKQQHICLCYKYCCLYSYSPTHFRNFHHNILISSSPLPSSVGHYL